MKEPEVRVINGIKKWIRICPNMFCQSSLFKSTKQKAKENRKEIWNKWSTPILTFILALLAAFILFYFKIKQ